MSISFKSLNFDLDTNSLLDIHPSKNKTQGYSDIRAFLEKNGFTHRQGSGYISNIPMKEHELLEVIDKLKDEFPWLPECIKKFDVTNIGETFDLTDRLKGISVSKDISQNNPNKHSLNLTM